MKNDLRVHYEATLPLVVLVLLVLPSLVLLLLVLPSPGLGLSTCLPGSPLEGHLRVLNRDRVVEGRKIKV